jgi:MFS family permease
MSSNGFHVLRHRNFSLYLSARILGTLAVQMQSVAIGWQVYAQTHNLFYLGMIGLAQFAPFLLLILIAGHAADRYNRRNIITCCVGAQLLTALLLLAYTHSGVDSVWPVFAILVLFGSARAFMSPATQAVLVNMVPTEDFSRAVALSSSSFHVAVILGPTLGGLLYIYGPATVYTTSALMLAGAVVLMLLTRPAPQATHNKPATWHSVLEGLRFVFSRPVVLGAISLDLFAMLLGGVTALLPIYAKDILVTGPWGLGLLRSAPAIGALAISIWLAHHQLNRRVGHVLFVAVAAFGVAAIAFAFSTSIVISIAALAVYGAADAVSVVIRHSLVQTRTPNEMLGRVMAVNFMFTGTSGTLGEFRAGAVAALFGAFTAVLVGGIGAVFIALLWMRLFPEIARIDTIENKPS